MSVVDERPPSLVRVEDALWVATRPIGVPGYDYAFEHAFACRHPARLSGEVTAVARMGAASDYGERYAWLRAMGIRLVHTPAQYAMTSELPVWYPRLKGLTPRSLWFEGEPDAARIGDELGWPVFLKGERQTSRHNPA